MKIKNAVKQKIKKILQLANKKSVKTIRMNPSWTRIPYNFPILSHFFVTNFHYVAAILTKGSANQRTGNTPRDHQFPIQSFYNPWFFVIKRPRFSNFSSFIPSFLSYEVHLFQQKGEKTRLSLVNRNQHLPNN